MAAVSPENAESISRLVCPICSQCMIELGSDVPEGLLGCAACAGWLANGIPLWQDAYRQRWWLDARDPQHGRHPMATLSWMMADGLPQPQFATARLRCAGRVPDVLKAGVETLGPAILVVVEVGDWRMPLAGGGRPC